MKNKPPTCRNSSQENAEVISDQVSTVNTHSSALRSGCSQRLEMTHSLSSLFIETSLLQMLSVFVAGFFSPPVRTSVENLTCIGGVREVRE